MKGSGCTSLQPMDDAPLHKALAPLEMLVGTWRGEGRGEYPTIEAFDYGEEVSFWHSGRPWLGYLQRTWSLEGNSPMHSESGFWRPQRDGSLEVVIAHAFGIVEVLEGSFDGSRIELAGTNVVSTSSAKVVDAITRTFEISGTKLTYDVAMAYGAHPLQHHLGADLEKATG